MIRDLWRRRIRFGRSKGISTVIATIFLVITVFFISTNVLVWTISQNNLYSQSVRESHQMDADRFSERVIAYDGNHSVLDDNDVQVRGILANEGPVSAQVLTLWVLDETNKEYNITDLRERKINLNPGDTRHITINVTVPGASSGDTFNSWFVTARGNKIPLEKEQGITVAQVAQGIGYLSMDFDSFKYYIVTDDQLGPPQSGFNVPSKDSIVFRLILTNLDEPRRDINLTAQSLLWLYSPAKKAQESWIIAKVVNQRLVNFDFQVLEFGNSTEVFFGPSTATQLAGSLCAVNLLLYGKIGTDQDYGQNLPFVAVYVQT